MPTSGKLSTSLPRFVFLGSVVAIATWWSISFSREPGTVSTVWASSGLLTAVLLSSSARMWSGYAVVALVANVAARAVHHEPIIENAGLSLAAVLESYGVAAAVVYGVKDLSNPAKLSLIGQVATASTLVACFLSALIAAATLIVVDDHASFLAVWWTWFAAHTLGMVIFATLGAVGLRRGRRLLGKPGRRVEFAITLAFIGAVCLAVFSQSHYTLLFVTYPPLLYCLFRYRIDGAVLGIAIVVLVATAATLSGSGPLLLNSGGSTAQALILQLFLAVTCLLAIPVAIVLTESAFLTRLVRDSEKRYRVLAENASDLVIRNNAEGKRLYVSPSVTEMLGWDVDAFNASPIDLLHPDDRSAALAAVEQLRREGGTATFSYRLRHQQGHYVWIEAKARLVASEDGALEIIYSGRDVTRRVEAEQALALRNAELEALTQKLAGAHTQMLQSEKMAAVGQLAAGVAHEINNPISFVRANLNCLSDYAKQLLALVESYENAARNTSDEHAAARARQLAAATDLALLKADMPSLVAESSDGLTRVESIVTNLRSFASIDQTTRCTIDVHEALENTLAVAAHELRAKAEVVREYGDLPPISCLPFQINQVFLNLLMNAVQAIEGHGVITVRTGREHDAIWVQIADTGAGIKPAHLARVFEPFFTTKTLGTGPGLGLSVAYRIVQEHGGTINVQSAAGVGATFTVRLPAAAGSPEST